MKHNPPKEKKNKKNMTLSLPSLLPTHCHQHLPFIQQPRKEKNKVVSPTPILDAPVEILQFVLDYIDNVDFESLCKSSKCLYRVRTEYIPGEIVVTMKPDVNIEWMIRKLNRYPEVTRLSIMWYVPRDDPRWTESIRDTQNGCVWDFVAKDVRIRRDRWTSLRLIGIQWGKSAFEPMPSLRHLELIDCLQPTIRLPTIVSRSPSPSMSIVLKGFAVLFPILESLHIEPGRTMLGEVQYLAHSLKRLDITVTVPSRVTTIEAVNQICELLPQLSDVRLLESRNVQDTKVLVTATAEAMSKVSRLATIGVAVYTTRGWITLDTSSSVSTIPTCYRHTVKTYACTLTDIKEIEKLKREMGHLPPSHKVVVSQHVQKILPEALKDLMEFIMCHHSTVLEHLQWDVTGNSEVLPSATLPWTTPLARMSSLPALRTLDFSALVYRLRHPLGSYFKLPHTLIRLRLTHVHITHSDMISLVYGCPHLETLRMYRVTVDKAAWEEEVSLPARLHTLDLHSVDLGLYLDRFLFQMSVSNLRYQRLLRLHITACGGGGGTTHSAATSIRTLTATGCAVVIV